MHTCKLNYLFKHISKLSFNAPQEVKAEYQNHINVYKLDLDKNLHVYVSNVTEWICFLIKYTTPI